MSQNVQRTLDIDDDDNAQDEDDGLGHTDERDNAHDNNTDADHCHDSDYAEYEMITRRTVKVTATIR